MTKKALIKMAKKLQPVYERWAGPGGGARVFLDVIGLGLEVVVWSDGFEDLGPVSRQNLIWDYASKQKHGGRICFATMTAYEYEDRYLFTKPPFCTPERGDA